MIRNQLGRAVGIPGQGCQTAWTKEKRQPSTWGWSGSEGRFVGSRWELVEDEAKEDMLGAEFYSEGNRGCYEF